jgi:hypothetical protein
MLKTRTYSLAGAALVVLVTASAHAAVSLDDVAGMWLFDEGSGDVAGDSSGNGNEGTLTGGTDWVEGPGVDFRRALELDGSGYVTIPDSDSLDMAETMSVTFWVRSDETMVDMWADRQVVFGKHYLEYEVGIYMGGQLHTYTSNLAGDYDEGILASMAGKLPDGDEDWLEDKWYHVAWTLDGTHEIAYVNGVLLGEYDKPNDGTDGGTHMLEIGRRGEGGLPLTGAVDDVGVFSVTLDEEDVVLIYERGLAAATGISPVELTGKLTAIWGELKTR